MMPLRLLISGHVLGSLALCLITLSLPSPPLPRRLSMIDAGGGLPAASPTPPAISDEQQPTPTPLPRPTPFVFDQYGNIPRDDAKARLDNFANALQEDPHAQGYLIVYGGQQGRADEAQRRAEFARNYLTNTRGIETGRLATIIAGQQNEASTELTVVPPGATLPLPSATVIPTPPPTTRPTPERQVASVARGPMVGSPRSSADDEYLEAAQAALDSLPEGSISFEPERNMTVGVPHRVTASVTRQAKEAVEAALPPGTPVRVYSLKVSGRMKVRLTGKADEFTIEPQSTEEQLVTGREYTSWDWSVTPLKEGTYKLELRATVIVRVGAGETIPKDLKAIEREITAKVAPSAASTPTTGPSTAPSPEPEGLVEWIVKNADWKWVFTVLIIPAVIYLWKRFVPDRPAAAAGGGADGDGPRPGGGGNAEDSDGRQP